tara:strand:+ start:186 stop:569 length:384 start_codon:yes stop_codon:yes gene_type:complete
MKKKLIENNNFNKLYHSNITIIILFVALIFSFIKVSKEIVLRYDINKEIKNLEGQFSELNKEKENLNNLVVYLETDDYIEEEARLKLNLSKPGEKQINLVNQDKMELKKVAGDKIANYYKWFNYFFK